MESSWGHEGGKFTRITRTSTTGNLHDFVDPEVVPSTLAQIAPILRVANEIDETSPRVAYLCRFYAFDRAHNLDSSSRGRGVRQFKTALLHKLEKDDEPTSKKRKAKTDAKEMQNYYREYYDNYLKSLETAGENMDRAQLAKAYQTATVLYDVLQAVSENESNEPVDPEVVEKAKHVKSKKEIVGPYNLLPLDAEASAQAIRKLPEVIAAMAAVRNVRGLDFGASSEKSPDTKDVLYWLQLNFGFQKDNVANQREHLILLLANVHIRQIPKPDPLNKLSAQALENVTESLFQNYRTWCQFLHQEVNIREQTLQQDKEQRSILYIGLYLLIWGEAANVRFMPECLCYIFHHMAGEVNGMLDGTVSAVTGEGVNPAYQGENAFLDKVISPIYNVIATEVSNNKDGRARHSAWRNYDDLNEFFWSRDCLRLSWPMAIQDVFFTTPKERRQGVSEAKRVWIGKCNFVEGRSFLQIFRSFDRMWSFFILALQIMVIVAWSGSGALTDIFKKPVLTKVLSVFITAALLRFIQAIVDIYLSFKAWRNMNFIMIFRYIAKVIMALAWVIILPVCYAQTLGTPIELLKTVQNWFGNSESSSVYSAAFFVYMAPDLLGVLMFFLPAFRRYIEQADHIIVRMLIWWGQPRLYVGRGMHEKPSMLFRYTLFWFLLLLSKILFSYYVEVRPLVAPTKEIIQAPIEGGYEWHEFFPRAKNLGVVFSLWSPIILVYFMDAQIWYAVWSTIFGGINGAFSRLGEIRNQEMLRSRFQSLPRAVEYNLIRSSDDRSGENGTSLCKKHAPKHAPIEESEDDMDVFAYFSMIWNEIIMSLHEEDYLSNHEKELLLIPASTVHTVPIKWPAFLLANKIAQALEDAKGFNHLHDASERISDRFMQDAIKECYHLLQSILRTIATGEEEKKIVDSVFSYVDTAMDAGSSKPFCMSAMPEIIEKINELIELLKDADAASLKKQRVTYLMQDILEVFTKDITSNTHSTVDLEDNSQGAHLHSSQGQTDNVSVDKIQKRLYFSGQNIMYPLPTNLRPKIERLSLLLTMRESAMDVPTNVEARRRILFFTNSLFMAMCPPPKIRNMLSFSVLTPYYNEEILYTKDSLEEDNEDGVSILYYLQKIYPDDWKNFMEREGCTESSVWDKSSNAVRQWASYRAQTLSRTVRGMMYYRRALKLQAFFDMAEDPVIKQGYNEALKEAASGNETCRSLFADIDAVVDMKFTYVVTCQKYGLQKRSQDSRAMDIFNLMKEYESLRVAYIDEEGDGEKKRYYSKLVKVIGNKDKSPAEQEIYSIKLPGNPILGEGKPENQNHAIIFTRGEALQAIDMNQDNYLEEALKIRNLLQEFLVSDGVRFPSILGMREHIFTGSVSSLAGFMSNQESSFVTIGQRVLANILRVRFHYGHPDVFERLFHISRGGISKASKGVNLSEDIFAGFNTTLRGGLVTHHEYIQVGKGRDVGLKQICQFEAKIANGNGEQTISRDVYRLGHRMDFFRMLSVYFTTVGSYFSTLILILTVYVFLYGRVYMVLSGLQDSMNKFAALENNTALEAALASQSFVQIGLLMALPMVMEIGLEQGFRKAFSEFIIMQLQLASLFFTFTMGTRVHFYGRTLLHGGAKYRATGRDFVVFHAKFAENYRLYSRSHFVKGLELLILLIVYNVYGASVNKTVPYLLITFSLWILVGTWLFSPFLFNPSGFEWQKIVEDWEDWNKWVNNRGGIGVPADKSWESWWDEEQSHLNTSGWTGQLIEILLSLRFFFYQYGLVYHLKVAHNSKSILVYVSSWAFILTLYIIVKVVSQGRRSLSADRQLFFRILKGLLFIAFIAVFIVLFIMGHLGIGDLFAGLIAFLPSGWAIIQIAQACKPIMGKPFLWESVKTLARLYENIMGLLLFMPIAILAWFPFISDFQTRLLFNQAFSRGLQISRILAGRKDKKSK